MKRIRIGLKELFTVRGFYAIFIAVVLLYAGNKKFEGFIVDQPFHNMGILIPLIKIPHDGNFFRVRRPNPKNITAFSAPCERMGTHRLIRFEIGSVME